MTLSTGQTPHVIALIPARSGSKRTPGKNVRLLNGAPLLAYAIATAREAGIFDSIAVSSDDAGTLEIAEQYGATELVLCPLSIAHKDFDPDIKWVGHALETHRGHDAFAILRPTSPFRRGEWVRKAWKHFSASRVDSLRAMRPVSEHPGKMWRVGEFCAHPVLPYEGMSAPWHSMPTQELPAVYVQTAALEIAWVRPSLTSIAGDVVLPWVCHSEDPESIDINSEDDWERVVRIAAEFPQWLPDVKMRATA